MANTTAPAAHGAHWPKGKRRHADAGDWARVRLEIQALLDEHPRHGVRSLAVIGRAVGVDKRTVWRWLRGEDRPPPEAQERLRAWAKEQRAALKTERQATS